MLRDAGQPWERRASGKHGIELGVRWATEDALGLATRGWGGNQVKRDLGQDHPGLVEVSVKNWVELEYVGCSG